MFQLQVSTPKKKKEGGWFTIICTSSTKELSSKWSYLKPTSEGKPQHSNHYTIIEHM